jgi:hypothetical protein
MMHHYGRYECCLKDTRREANDKVPEDTKASEQRVSKACLQQ